MSKGKKMTKTLIKNIISERILAITFAFSLGVLFLYGSGFAQSASLHDAAHDTRHSIGFPCH